MMLANGPLLPMWLVLPMAGLVLLTLAAHVLAMRIADMPESRRRIRTASAILMMFITALLAYAFGVVDREASPRAFIFTWTTVTAMVGMVVILALLDALNTLLLHRHTVRDNRRRLRSLRDEARRILSHHARRTDENDEPKP